MKAKVRRLLAGGMVLDDDELAGRLKVARQQINQVAGLWCRMASSSAPPTGLAARS
jgi:hypothetical protein